jgi:hypothetical protein
MHEAGMHHLLDLARAFNKQSDGESDRRGLAFDRSSYAS